MKCSVDVRSQELKKIRVHDLRHSHASLLIEMGCQPLLIADRLGHEKNTDDLKYLQSSVSE